MPKGNLQMKGRIIPPKLLNIILALVIGLHFILPIKRIIHPPYTYLGFLFILPGIILNIWSVSLLRKRDTAVDFFEQANRLVTDGPFRFSRNPVYLSGLIVALGIAVLLGSLLTFIFTILSLLILDRLYIPFEEKRLAETFGKEYLEYKRKVRKWI